MSIAIELVAGSACPYWLWNLKQGKKRRKKRIEGLFLVSAGRQQPEKDRIFFNASYIEH
jgi:hypothetical protein